MNMKQNCDWRYETRSMAYPHTLLLGRDCAVDCIGVGSWTVFVQRGAQWDSITIYISPRDIYPWFHLSTDYKWFTSISSNVLETNHSRPYYMLFVRINIFGILEIAENFYDHAMFSRARSTKSQRIRTNIVGILGTANTVRVRTVAIRENVLTLSKYSVSAINEPMKIFGLSPKSWV